MQILEMVLGGVLVAVGVALGRWLPDRRRSPEPSRPTCGCGHGLAFHDPATGECHAPVAVAEYGWRGDLVGESHSRCECRQYDGPTPLPTVYAPEIAGGV